MEKPPKKPRQDSEYLSTLERGLSVLRAFNQSRPEMQLSEVAAATGLNPAVARRCLNTLVQLGYVAQHGRRFLLRPEVLVFGSAFLASMNIEQIAGPHLQAVRDETGDSSSMAVLSGTDILYLAHVSTNRRIRLGASVDVFNVLNERKITSWVTGSEDDGPYSVNNDFQLPVSYTTPRYVQLSVSYDY